MRGSPWRALRDQERTALWWAAGLGAFGVLSGFALFIVVRRTVEDLWIVGTALVVAAAVSFGGECVRELVRRGHVFEDAAGPIVLRAVSTFLVVFVIELFVHAWHASAEHLAPVLNDFTRMMLFEPAAGERHGPWLVFVLILISALWVGLGALLSWTFAVLILVKAPDRPTRASSEEERDQLGFVMLSPLVGVLVGLAVPLVLLALVLVIRLGQVLWVIATDYAAWRANLEALSRLAVIGKLTAPLRFVDNVLAYGNWSQIVLLALAVCHAFGWLWRRGPALAAGIVVWALFLPSIAYDLGTLRRLLAVALLLWLIPGVALGIALPFLRRPRAPYWSAIAGASGIVLAALGFSQAGGSSEWLAAGVAFALAAILVVAGLRDELTMLVALITGLAIYAAALIPATMLGAISDFVFLGSRPVVGSAGPGPDGNRAQEIDRVIRTHPEVSRLVRGWLADANVGIRQMQEKPYQERGREIDRWLMELRRWQLDLIRGNFPDPAWREIQAGPWPERSRSEILGGKAGDAEYQARVIKGRLEGAGVAWWAREEWLRTTITYLERAKRQWEAEGSSERVRAKNVDRSAAGKLNAAVGGAIGFTVSLGLLAAWRIKDGDEAPPDHS